MQRIRKQQQSRYQLWLRSAKHRRLPATVRVAAKKYASRYLPAHNRNRIVQSGTIALRIAWKRRSSAPLLTEGKIAAQNDIAMSGKSFAERRQQRSRAIGTRSVSQDQRVAIGIRGQVQKAADSRFQGIITEFDEGVVRRIAAGA